MSLDYAAERSDQCHDWAIESRALTKMYGSLAAVDAIDLIVPRGAVYGLIGPNGAGKSTLMTMMASLLLPTAGSLSVLGFDPVLQPIEVRSRIGYMPDGLGVYDGMSVSDYLDFFAGAYGIDKSERPDLITGLLELVELSVKRDAEVNSLSRGMKQRLSLARALVHDPELLILDEPASGLDPRARVELRELIAHLQSMGKTIIVSSHILSELQEICTHVGIVEAGKLLASGPPREILERLGGQRAVKVRFADGTEEDFLVDDEAAQVDLLRRFILEDRDVLEYVEVSSGLEAVFLSVTEGIVQ
ncbi:MAG: ABC transporter ATP-binding protein [Actinobacteria bacterium]|nr:ABC transporter ATP-binding protein [Actinomycetota bacterium]